MATNFMSKFSLANEYKHLWMTTTRPRFMGTSVFSSLCHFELKDDNPPEVLKPVHVHLGRANIGRRFWELDPLKSTKMTCLCSRRASGHSIPIERCSEKYLLSHSACWAGPIQHDARKRCGRGNFSSAKLQYFGARLMFLARAV